jgi:deoxyribonuclease-4
MSISGGHDQALRSAQAVGFKSAQLFTKSTNQWAAKPLTELHIEAFRVARAEFGIGPVVAHTSYLINLGSPDQALWRKSIDALTIEVERAEVLGIADLVCHPGAHMGVGEAAGLARIARGLDALHRRTRGVAVRIDLETTAGQGTCLGCRFEHLRAILNNVAEPERLGICVDTCHIFAAGYPLESEEEYNETLADLDRAVGLSRVRVWHLNDSARERGSRVDRHAGIGRGKMGLAPFRHVVNDPRFVSLPLVLETPKGTEGGQSLDALNLRVLRRLWRKPSAAEPRSSRSSIKTRRRSGRP